MYLLITIFIAGYLVYGFTDKLLLSLSNKSDKMAKIYEETKKPSYLWQSTLLYPTRQKIELLRLELIRTNSCEDIMTLDFILKKEGSLEYYECQILKNVTYKDNDIKSLLGNQRAELLNFIKIMNGKKATPADKPETNLGKIHKMISLNNYTLYQAENELGLLIAKLNKIYKGNQPSIALSNVLYEQNKHYLSIFVIQSAFDNYNCLTEPTKIVSKNYLSLDNETKAKKYLKDLLECDPSNIFAINELLMIADLDSSERDALIERKIEIESLRK